jgi:DNA-binding CsgD family transcriptional regulator
MRHLRQAVATAHRLGRVGEGNVGAEDPLHLHLETLPEAMCIVDDQGGLVFANSSLVKLAREVDGIVLSAREFRLARADENQRFQRLCSSARPSSLINGPGGGAMPISRPSGRRPYMATVSPLAGKAGSVLVTVNDLDRTLSPSPERLVAAFGLTRSEARVAAYLFEMGRLEDVAAASGTSIGTVRHQLKSVFDKTGTTRQAELMTLIARTLR